MDQLTRRKTDRRKDKEQEKKTMDKLRKDLENE